MFSNETVADGRIQEEGILSFSHKMVPSQVFLGSCDLSSAALAQMCNEVGKIGEHLLLLVRACLMVGLANIAHAPL